MLSLPAPSALTSPTWPGPSEPASTLTKSTHATSICVGLALRPRGSVSGASGAWRSRRLERRPLAAPSRKFMTGARTARDHGIGNGQGVRVGELAAVRLLPSGTRGLWNVLTGVCQRECRFWVTATSMLSLSSFPDARALERLPLRVATPIDHTHLARRKACAVKVNRPIVDVVAIVTGCICPQVCRTRGHHRGRQCGVQIRAVQLRARSRYRGRGSAAEGSG